MNWQMMFRVKELFNEYNIKPVIGVIPQNEDEELKSYPMCDFSFWDEVKNLKNEGWEIAMHGYQHLYEKDCYKDYLGHGGKTEFANVPYEKQLEKINYAKDIFEKNKIQVKSFFAPNHTFDKNTIKACKTSGINFIIDGYGIAPYHEDDVLFFPQLFYRLHLLPFGFQTLQIHLNNFNENDFLKLSKFIERNHKKIISFGEARIIFSDTLLNKTSKFLLKSILRFKRLFIK